MQYSHRERVRASLSHREADRIPFDLGGTFWSSVHLVPYQALKSHFGINDKDSIILKNGQIAGIHEPILQEMESLLQKMKDPLSKEVLTKMKNLILLDHALNSITLADLMIKNYETQLEIDDELLAISDSVSQMLEIHLSEADSLRKLR